MPFKRLTISFAQHIIVDDPITAGVTLNSDLYKIHNWASESLVAFHPAKSESLLISRKVDNLITHHYS